MVVHPRFLHFFSMLWFLCRIDHVLKNMAKNWMVGCADNNKAAEASAGVGGDDDGIDICHQFSEQNAETVEAMGIMFQHAASHVQESLCRLRDAQ